MKLLLLYFSFIIGFVVTSSEGQLYSKTFYNDGTLEAEGWMMDSMKVNYWFFYNTNGTLKAKGDYNRGLKDGYWYLYSNNGELKNEGHYVKGLKDTWWISYNSDIKIETQYKANKKDGFSFWYKNDKMFKAERFKNNLKEGEWTSILAFKRDNPNPKF